MRLLFIFLFAVLVSTSHSADTHRMSIAEVQAEYQNYKKQYPKVLMSFESFAAQMDAAQKVDKRFEAYKGKPELYPVMPKEWAETAYRRFKKDNPGSLLTIAEFGWAIDCQEGGARYREAYREHYVGLVVLYDFMGMDQVPLSQVYVVEKRAGYIKLIPGSGKAIVHSGRYSIIH